MNVIHINQSDISGGAAIAAYRLHKGLIDQEINSKLLVGAATSDSSDIALVPKQPLLEAQLLRFTAGIGLNYLNYVNTFQIPSHNFYKEAQILNFHNLHGGYFSYAAIPALTCSKPAVFTLHDMWSFTGHCAFSHDCERWETGCGHCPYPDEYPQIRKDNTRLEWNLKKLIYKLSNIAVVSPSTWLTQLARRSMLQRFQIHHIPNGIDITIYQPIHQKVARQKLAIPENKKVLMFVAGYLKTVRKGADLLIKALEGLSQDCRDQVVILTVGNGGENLSQQLNLPTINLGYVADDATKAIAYSAADLFILPTRADNLPVVLQESMACGTPMVSFSTGGVPDLVRPGLTGYLADPENPEDLCRGIVQLLENNELRESMRRICREVAVTEYSLELQAKRYVKLYETITSTQPENNWCKKVLSKLRRGVCP